MKLKYKLESLDGLSDEIKSCYEEKDGVFILIPPEGMPQGEDVTGLKAKVDELLNEKKAEAEKARTATEAARQAAEDAAKEKGDFEALSKSYKEKIESLEAQIEQGKKEANQKEIERQSVIIAAGLAEGANQEILSTFIGQRLRMEDGELKVTDEKGNLTISTVDQLTDEFKNNAKFASLITASKASGSGASGAQGGDGGSSGKKFSEMNEKERTELYNSNPEEYRRLRDQDKPN
jgi:hypothetical protein